MHGGSTNRSNEGVGEFPLSPNFIVHPSRKFQTEEFLAVTGPWMPGFGAMYTEEMRASIGSKIRSLRNAQKETDLEGANDKIDDLKFQLHYELNELNRYLDPYSYGEYHTSDRPGAYHDPKTPKE